MKSLRGKKNRHGMLFAVWLRGYSVKRTTTKKLTKLILPTGELTPSRPPRKHIPALDDVRLAAALQQVDALKIDRASRGVLADILKAASNPDAESLPVVLASLPKPRRRSVDKTAAQIQAITRGIMTRARDGLSALSDADWDALVDKANNGN